MLSNYKNKIDKLLVSSIFVLNLSSNSQYEYPVRCLTHSVFSGSIFSAVFIMAAGLLVYPFGLNSSLVRSFCGDSDIYYAGECQIGWGYMLAIVGVMLTVFLPFFAKYAPKEQLSPTPLPTLL